MNLDLLLRSEIQKATTALFDASVPPQLQPTNQEFEGSHTVVCFPFTKVSKKGPEETARLIGEYLLANSDLVSKFNVVKGFLNLSIKDSVWIKVFGSIYSDPSFRPAGVERQGSNGGVFFTEHEQAAASWSFEK